MLFWEKVVMCRDNYIDLENVFATKIICKILGIELLMTRLQAPLTGEVTRFLLRREALTALLSYAGSPAYDLAVSGVLRLRSPTGDGLLRQAAFSACCNIFTAAFMSRCRCVPQFGHIHSRTFRFVSPFVISDFIPHTEHVCVEAQYRSTNSSLRPCRAHLYSSWRLNSYHAASYIAPASLWFFAIFLLLRSSSAITSQSFTILVVALCRSSLRRFFALWCKRATLCFCFQVCRLH